MTRSDLENLLIINMLRVEKNMKRHLNRNNTIMKISVLILTNQIIIKKQQITLDM